MAGFVDDFLFAQQNEVAVEVTLISGEEIFTGVHSVDEAGGTVSLWAPVALGGDTTRRRIRLDDVTSVTVTDVSYPPPTGEA